MARGLLCFRTGAHLLTGNGLVCAQWCLNQASQADIQAT